MSQPVNFNETVIAEFRANGGKVGSHFANANVLLLHTTGAKSGAARVNPLVYFKDGERIVIAASKAGAPTNPDWYHNILAHPIVTVEIGNDRYQARAVVADAAERDRIYEQIGRENAGFAQYQQQTSRKIPVIVLERVTP